MDPVADPWLSAFLAGRYRVVARIGAGGMGVVYRAWDSVGDRYVVVKTPRRELLGDAKFVIRFQQELSALRSLAHPAVVPIIDLGEEQGVPYAVMPYLAGGSLKQRRTQHANKTYAAEPPVSLWRWLPSIAQAIDFVHANGYIHRDVKPDNILFDGHARPYLSDFGVAKTVFLAEDVAATRGLTGTGFALGTPDYMAPELISGVKPAPPVDQYALAVMTYELLSGRKPFDGPTPAAILIAHASSNATSLATLCPEVPMSAIAAVERGMHRDPCRRFESCGAFAAAVLVDITEPSTAGKMQLICPHCDRLLNVKPEWAGKQGSCPRCKTALAIASDLASLWSPGERGEKVTTQRSAHSPRFGSTPSAPVTIPRTTLIEGQSRPPSAAEAVWRTFASSSILQAGAASVAAFALLAAMLGPVVIKQRATKQKPGPRHAIITDTRPDVSHDDSKAGGAAPAQTAQSAAVPPAPPPLPAVSEGAIPEAPVAMAAVAPVQPTESDERPSTPAPSPVEDAGSIVADPPERAAKPLAPTPSPERLSVPAADGIAAATELIKQAFADTYEAVDRAGNMPALVGRLEAAESDTSDPVRRYALLLEAERLATEAADLPQALALVSKRCQLFVVDCVAEKLRVIGQVAKVAPAASAPLCDDFMDAAYDHLTRDEYAVAEQLADNALRLAKVVNRGQKQAAAQAKKKTAGRSMMKRPSTSNALPPADVDGASLIEQAEALSLRVDEQREKYEAFAAATMTLQDRPDDSAAHEAVGRFLCFMKAEWQDGLPHLAQGVDASLVNLAHRHDALMDASPSDLFRIAGEWWDAGDWDTLSELERTAAREFAAMLYRDILPGLDDPVDVALAKKRAADETPRRSQETRSLADLLEGTNAAPIATSGTAMSMRPRPRGDGLLERKSDEGRKQRLAAYGGTPATESAVDAALAWIAEHQMADGGWTFNFPQCPACNGACANPGGSSHQEDRAAATALALLPFLGRGMSHRDGPYRKELLAGIGFLAGLSTAGNGKCFGRQGTFYSQGLAAIALSEVYGMTKDPRLKVPAQAAINYIMDSQDPQGGGWRYTPRQPGDTSVTGWQVTALKTADMAGLAVNPTVLVRANVFLNSVQQDNGKAYGYTDGGSGYATSAIGLLCRSYLGTREAVPQYRQGIDRVASRGPGADLYFNYYSTCLLREVGGPAWEPWNRAMQRLLLDSQSRNGHEKGSWYDSFTGGHTADIGGRLVTTSLATLILEAPYRCLESTRP
jgi:serine/threonine protein kinase